MEKLLFIFFVPIVDEFGGGGRLSWHFADPRKVDPNGCRGWTHSRPFDVSQFPQSKFLLASLHGPQSSPSWPPVWGRSKSLKLFSQCKRFFIYATI